MRVLIVGASGHNGAAVARRLSAAGHHVRGLVRDPGRAPDCLAEVVVGDAVTGAGLAEATADIDVAYYFVHSLDSAAQDDHDLVAARNFAEAAATAGVRRGIFFTTLPAPDGVAEPRYQRNRRVVEDVLTERLPGMTAVRAGMVLGDRSRGMRPYVQLVQRAPIIPMGPWRRHRMAVVDSETTTTCLVRAGVGDRPLGRIADVPASAEPTHEELIRAVMRVLGRRVPIIGLPVSSVTVDAFLTSRFTDDSFHFSRHLASINNFDYLVDPSLAAPFADVTPLDLDTALQAALPEAVAA
ncbi:SDR family oxidoreductase [Gordonia soli]|uniref:NAD(P)-binding domain-containing protein n=1 Tax=Gordonia soli NBRC 108243 TaxID=1223545 RepID=M0QQG4_9ACTN|nr:NAD(P)H-binding protein [Gordonia soli]GAC70905.1 hypothetical protein GS4_43_00320 [Gordonia soli NBRC 108243]